MKVKVVCRKMYNYVQYDLKEIAFPSSLPDPAHIKRRRKLTWHERFLVLFFSNFSSAVLKEASRLYAASWVRDIGPDLRPNDYKKDDVTEGKSNGNKSRSTETEPSTLEDIGEELYSVSYYSDDRTVILRYLAIAARGGMETLRPALQRLYMTRASAYRDALKSFIEGYQEGIQQDMEKNEDSSKHSKKAILIKIQLNG
ncbi:hypothetical protein GOBAR_DD35514 [Gossypium barbadense]|nr:hypothetical protein GOBAR_DD35514 [Gossypium barbadense]